MAFSVPSILKSRWQLAGRAFGIASSYNDRSFRGGREIYDEAIRQRPAHASVWVLRPVTSRISVRAGYDLDYTRLRAAPETSAAFVVPADQSSTARGSRSKGSAAAGRDRSGGTPRVEPAGARGEAAADYEPDHATFQRFGVAVAKSTVLSPRVVARVEAQWMDGQDLDRSAVTRSGRSTIGCAGILRRSCATIAAGSSAARWRGRLRRCCVSTVLSTPPLCAIPGYGGGLRNYTGHWRGRRSACAVRPSHCR